MNLTRCNRADDERILAMLALRDEGLRADEIGPRFSITANAARKVFRKIDADTGDEAVSTVEQTA
jgi:hypothetical protein